MKRLFVCCAAAVAAAILAAGPASADEALLDRGRYLVQGVVACGNCHTPQTPEGPDDTRELSGGMPIAMPDVMHAIGPNITPDRETGIGAWSDDEIVRAIREGVRPDGSLVGPPMPFMFYRDISDRDMQAIVAYLRHVEPVRNEVPASTYEIPLPPAWGPPVDSVPEPDRSDRLAYGAYLAGPLGHCLECHSPPDEKGLPDVELAPGAGGFPFYGPWGVSYSANITPSNLADWSDEEIATAIRSGVRPDGSRAMPPMPFSYYENITDEDMTAIVAWLRSLAPR